MLLFSLGSARATADRRAADGFDGQRPPGWPARSSTLAPDRTPGSEGDARSPSSSRSASAGPAEARSPSSASTGSFDDDDVEHAQRDPHAAGRLSAERRGLAPRDSAGGPGAASSARRDRRRCSSSSRAPDRQSTQKTLIFVSTDGSGAGAAGAKEFAQHYLAAGPDRRRSGRPLAARLGNPAASPSSLDVVRRPAERLDPARRAPPSARSVGVDGAKPASQGTVRQPCADLAVPSGLGEQAVLIQSGLESVGLSSAGDRPLPASQDQAANLSPQTVTDFGRTALLARGGARRLARASRPRPGLPTCRWPGSSSPAGRLRCWRSRCWCRPRSAAGDGILNGLPRPVRHPGWALAWAGSRAVPLLAGLFFFYLLALVGLVARPTFPFDPNLYGVGPGQVIVMLLCAGISAAPTTPSGVGWSRRRSPGRLRSRARRGVPSPRSWSGWPIPSWALLLVPTAHVWLTCARRRGALPWPAVAGAALVSLLPLIAAIDHVSGELALGGSAPWLLLLMVSGGQIGFGTMFSLSLVLGGCSACSRFPSAAGSRPGSGHPGPHRPARWTASSSPSPSRLAYRPRDWTHCRSRPARKMTI